MAYEREWHNGIRTRMVTQALVVVHSLILPQRCAVRALCRLPSPPVYHSFAP